MLLFFQLIFLLFSSDSLPRCIIHLVYFFLSTTDLDIKQSFRQWLYSSQSKINNILLLINVYANFPCIYVNICIYIYIFFFFISSYNMWKHVWYPALISHQPRGNNTVSVGQGRTATPDATKQLLPLDRVSKKLCVCVYIYIYIYICQIN